MATPKYTFLLPAFKGRYLDEMLRSIKAQTYTDFKVLISDDCSPEDLRSICEPYLSDPRFTFRRNEENMGSKSLVSHWNLLVDMCDTEYLIMASDDDVYEPQFLAEIDALVQKYHNVDLFRGRVRQIDGEGDLLEQDMLLEEYHSQINFLYYFFHYDMLKCVANYAFRTSALKKQGGFYDLPLAWGSDDATIVKLSGNGICYTPSVTFSFRSSGLNISTKGNLGITLKKTRARYLYIQFLESFLCQVMSKAQTKMEKAQCKKILEDLREGIYIQSLFYGAQLSSYRDMMTYYRYLDSHGHFQGRLDKIHFIWSWIRAYKTRKG